MKCVICKLTQPGALTVTLERDVQTFVFRRVPARVCDNCGEAYVEQDAATKLLRQIDEAIRSGVQVDICQYNLIPPRDSVLRARHGAPE